MTKRDRLYIEPRSDLEAFVFDDKVARVFPDMIRRSLPAYASTLSMTGMIGAHYAQENTHIYDLGCAQGASIISVARQLNKHCRLVGIDSSASMIKAAKQQSSDYPIKWRVENILDSQLEVSSVIIMNFTLQFVEPHNRKELVTRIYQALSDQGILLLSEKMVFDKNKQGFIDQTYDTFKKANGYCDLEISQKRTALEKSLFPESFEEHSRRLKAIGFREVYQWQQALGFVSLIAIK